MASVRRVIAVTAGLAAAGFVVGGMVGAIVAGTWLVMAGFSPSRGDVGLSIVGTAMIGGVLGMVLGPTAAWLLMRRVPIGRALAETALGTAVGSLLGFLLQSFIPLVPFPPLILALVGFAAAALRLRLTHRTREAIVAGSPEE